MKLRRIRWWCLHSSNFMSTFAKFLVSVFLRCQTPSHPEVLRVTTCIPEAEV